MVNSTRDAVEHRTTLDELERPDPHRLSRRQALIAFQGDTTMIYAARTDDGLIKIGCSSNVAQRSYTVGTEILGLRNGDFDDEAAIHAQLRDHVARGEEYYHPTPAVLAVVNSMRASFGLAPLDH